MFVSGTMPNAITIGTPSAPAYPEAEILKLLQDLLRPAQLRRDTFHLSFVHQTSNCSCSKYHHPLVPEAVSLGRPLVFPLPA